MLKNSVITSNPTTINAISFCEYTLTIAMLKDKVASLDKKLNSKTLMPTVKQVEAWTEEKAGYESDIETYSKAADKIKADYESTIATLTATNDKGFGNSEQAVKNILNLIATAKNSKLEKYALADQVWDDSLANAFDTIHLFSKPSKDGAGAMSMSKAVKASYKAAADLIDNTLRQAFSLPVATDYNVAFRCKFNNTTLKMLHELYITGLSNKYSKSNDDDALNVFEGAKVRALISTKKNKNGTVTYNYSKFNTVIAKLVIAKIAEA